MLDQQAGDITAKTDQIAQGYCTHYLRIANKVWCLHLLFLALDVRDPLELSTAGFPNGPLLLAALGCVGPPM